VEVIKTARFRSLHLTLPQLALSLPAAAQSFLVEGGGGAGQFTESVGFDHWAASGSARWQVTPRLSVGPEVVYLEEPGDHHDLLVTGNVVFDFKTKGITPYVLGGAGLFRQTTVFTTGSFSDTFTSTEGSVTGGFGVRIPFARGWYVAPEARIAWEPHVRLQVLAGYRWD
jgi:hypothetical protein